MTRKNGKSKKPENGNWQNRIVGFELVEPDQLLANPHNWRIHPQAQQEALVGVLNKVGWWDALKINVRTGHILDGHLREHLALRHDQGKVPVLYVDLSEEEEKLALATHDPLSTMAVVDDVKMLELLASAEAETAAFIAETLKEWDFSELLGTAPAGEDPGAEIDRAEELREKWQVESGQLWELGDHRLICGDCTDRATVERVMRGEKADAVVTDPPYGVGIDYKDFKDTKSNVKALVDAFMPTLDGMGPIALTPGNLRMWLYPEPAWVGAWVHPAPMGRCPWGFDGNNPILFYGPDPYLKAGKGSRPDSVVMAADREGVEGHPTPKPFKVWAWLVERMTTEVGQVVYDPFLGSGTTLIACERLGRKCRAVEISPAYCAVTLERWATMSDQTPRRVEG